MLLHIIAGLPFDTLIYTPTGENQTVFTDYKDWDNQYLRYSPGKVFYRCGDSAHIPSDWLVGTVSSRNSANACNGSFFNQLKQTL